MLLLRPHAGAAPPPPAVTPIPTLLLRRNIAARYVTIDGYPVEVGALECSSVVNLGYDQFRAVSSHHALQQLPWTATLGSTVTVNDATGQIVWQGRLSAAPRIESDRTVRLAAQGHLYQAAKSVRRLPVKVTQVQGWVVANTAPLDFPQTASAQPTIGYSASGKVARNRFIMSFTSATDVSAAYYATGSTIRSFVCSGFTCSGTPSSIKFWGCTGPDVFENKTLVATYVTADIVGGAFVVEFRDAEFDCIVIELTYASPTSGNLTVVNPVISSSQERSLFTSPVRAHNIVRAIAEMLGWDASLVEDVGTAQWPSFDWAGDVAGGLLEATVPDDLRVLVLDDRGHGPVVDLGGWERTWEVSAASGATWALDPLEAYTKVVVQYLDDIGKANAVTAEAPAHSFSVVNELQTVAGGLQSVDEPSGLPELMAENLLEYASSQRWRGSVNASQVYEAGTGLQDLYRVRAGDLVRITDFSPTDGAITLRISEVSQQDDGITMGIAAPAFPTGNIGGTTGGVTQGTFIQIDPDAYAPPGGPGSTTPVFGGGPGIIIDPFPSTGGGSLDKLKPPKF